MKAYIDTSVLLRVILGEPDRLANWSSIEYGVSSALIEVESLRTLDRLRLREALTEDQLAQCRISVFTFLDALEIVALSKPVLTRASSPFPTSLGTLDAIHLSTALAYQDIRNEQLAFATHDKMLATAARMVGLEVLGA